MAGLYGAIKEARDALREMECLPNLEARFVTASDFQLGPVQMKQWGYRWAESKMGTSRSGKVSFCYCGYFTADELFKEVDYSSANPADICAEAFERKDSSVFPRLNGSWAALVWDEASEKLTLATDRLATLPLYYTEKKSCFSFSTSQLALARYNVEVSKLNPEGVAEFLTLGYAQDDRTYIEGVRVLEGASTLTWQKGQVSVAKYWTPDLSPCEDWKDADATADHLNVLLDKAMERCCMPDGRMGVALSGGLDSRMIAARLRRQCHVAAVFGDEDSAEIGPALQVAAKLGIETLRCNYTPDDCLDRYVRWIEINDGFISTPEYLLLAETLASQCELVFFGVLGDAIRGHCPCPGIKSSGGERHLRAKVFARENQQFLPVSHAGRAFGAKISKELRAAPRLNFHRRLDEIDSPTLFNKYVWQNLTVRQRRRVCPAFSVVRAFAGLRSPYFDADLLAFVLGVPGRFRDSSVDVYRLAFIRKYSDLAAIRHSRGCNYIEEAKGGLFWREVKSKLWFSMPLSWQTELWERLGNAPQSSSHRTSYQTTMLDPLRRYSQILVDGGILEPTYVEKLLAPLSSGGIARFGLFQKVLTLGVVMDRYGLNMS